MHKKQSLFRKESLERLSSPEQLDQLLAIVKSRDWLPLATAAGLIVLTLLWSIWGRIPNTVVGQGVLIAMPQVSNARSLGELATQNSPRWPAQAERLMAVLYFSIEDGKRIRPGMTVHITPTIVEREQFGGMIGLVTQISEFPVTLEAAAQQVGSAELVRLFLQTAPQLQVLAQLQVEPTNFSGYRWSASHGPREKFSPGTPAIARVTIAERAPITYLLPILGPERVARPGLLGFDRWVKP